MRERIMHSVTRHVNQIAVVVHEQDYRINDIRNSDTVPNTCHCCFCLFVPFACMARIMYIPEACRLRGSGVDFSLLYPLTWILKACSDVQKAVTCWRVAPHVRELLAPATAALAAPGHRRPAPSARRVPTGLQVRLAGEKAKTNSYAVVTCKGKGNGGCRQASQKAALAAKAHLDKTFFSPTGSTRWSAATPSLVLRGGGGFLWADDAGAPAIEWSTLRTWSPAHEDSCVRGTSKQTQIHVRFLKTGANCVSTQHIGLKLV